MRGLSHPRAGAGAGGGRVPGAAPLYDRKIDPVTEQAPAMSVRTALAALLLSLALPAVAQDAGAGDDGLSCTSDYAGNPAPDPDPARASKRVDADKPAIPRGAGSDSNPARQPRWHSFLPGMFR